MLAMFLRWKKVAETTLLIWVENVIPVSIIRPVFLEIWLRIISAEPIWSLGKSMVSMWREANSINSVLSSLHSNLCIVSLNLISLTQASIFLVAMAGVWVVICWKVKHYIELAIISIKVVGYSMTFGYICQANVYILKCLGPRTEPCVTPHDSDLFVDDAPFICTVW